MPRLAAGDLAPDFKLPDQDGVEVSLADLRRQVGKSGSVVVYYYPADDTPGCTKEACAFRDGFSDFRKRKIEVLGVSADDEKSHKKFAEKFHLPFRLLADTDRKIVQAYGAWGDKSLYGRLFKGIYRVTYLIDEKGKIAAVWPKVKPDEHAAEILEFVDGGAPAKG
jgi:peroxiredoxin Q/BCP